MKKNAFLLTILLPLGLGVGGCDSEPLNKESNTTACSGVPIPQAELLLTRTTGAPNSGAMGLPAVSSVCLEVETNAASAGIAIDGTDVFGPSDFKNKQTVLYRTVAGLSLEPHLVTADIAGKPQDHYVKITAYYAVGKLAKGSEIGSTDEALFLAQAYLATHSTGPLFGAWGGAIPASVTPLQNMAGGIEAYEIEIKKDGVAAGYLVLEAEELRPILGSASTEGVSLSRELLDEYLTTYGDDPVADGADYRFVWHGAGMLGLEVTMPNDVTRTVNSCDECLASYISSERAPYPYIELGISAVEWISKRQDSAKSMIVALTGGEPQADQGHQVMLDIQSGAPEPTTHGINTCVGNDFEDIESCPEVSTLEDYELTDLLPGGRNAFSYYYQINDAWDSDDPNAPAECNSGCTPIAALTIMDYWDTRGYNFLISDKDKDDNANITDDEDLETAINGIRGALKTNCKLKTNPDAKYNSGSTYFYSNFENLESYINEAAGTYADGEGEPIDMGWDVDILSCPDPDSRFQAAVGEIYYRRPAILSYVSNWRKGPLCQDNVSDHTAGRHTAVVYGYLDDGDTEAYDDLFAVRTGWKKTKARYEPIVGTGKTYVASVVPGCSPGVEPPLCRTFTDLPNGEWGRVAAETLSCMCAMQGFPDGNFDKDAGITKAEFIKTILRLVDEDINFDNTPKDVPLSGVSKEHWASGYIYYAYKNSMLGLLVNGDLSFSPDALITREEAAYFLVRASKVSEHDYFEQLDSSYNCLTGNEVSPYGDLDKDSSIYYRYALAATNVCIFEGYAQGNEKPDFDPSALLTRREAAKVGCVARFGIKSDKCTPPPHAECAPVQPQCYTPVPD